MYDNYSTDNSVELAKSFGMEVRSFGLPGILNDQHYLDVKNHCWKEQRNKGVDYVIVVDADEFIGPSIHLSCAFPKVKGFNMISENLPIKSMSEINIGEPSESYSKRAIFSPDKIQEINFVHGCHRNNAIGETNDNYDTCLLYHFRCIGGFERLYNRHLEYQKRMSKFNRDNNMGHHYLVDRETKLKEWEIMKQNSKELW